MNPQHDAKCAKCSVGVSMYYVVALGHELNKNPVLNVKLCEIAVGRKIHRHLRRAAKVQNSSFPTHRAHRAISCVLTLAGAPRRIFFFRDVFTLIQVKWSIPIVLFPTRPDTASLGLSHCRKNDLFYSPPHIEQSK